MNYLVHNKTRPLWNAVHFFTETKGITFREAKKLVLVEISKIDECFRHAMDELVAITAATAQLRRWLKLIELMISGNAIWSSTTKKYQGPQVFSIRYLMVEGNESLDSESLLFKLGISLNFAIDSKSNENPHTDTLEDVPKTPVAESNISMVQDKVDDNGFQIGKDDKAHWV